MGIKWGRGIPRVPDAVRRVTLLRGARTIASGAPAYAMNMRAADAIVSSAPKAIKIFPISEV
jgi:hypothetical protein